MPGHPLISGLEELVKIEDNPTFVDFALAGHCFLKVLERCLFCLTFCLRVKPYLVFLWIIVLVF